MTVANTSIETYHDLQSEGVLSKQESIIVNAINWYSTYSLQELCKLTGLQINAVSGRVNSLKNKGILKVWGKRKCQVTGRLIQAVCK